MKGRNGWGQNKNTTYNSHEKSIYSNRITTIPDDSVHLDTHVAWVFGNLKVQHCCSGINKYPTSHLWHGRQDGIVWRGREIFQNSFEIKEM